MPTDKRARQRAAREQKQATIQKSRKRRRNTRRGVYAVIVAAAIVGIVFAVNAGTKSATTTTTTTTTSTTTTTTTFPPPTTQPLTTAAQAPTCPPVTGSKSRVVLFKAAPPQCIPAGSVWEATFETSLGNIVEKLSAAASPAGVNNFVFLSLYHYFDGTDFFRVVKGFVVQGGAVTDTDTDGATGGASGLAEYGYPGYRFTGNTPPASCSSKPSGPDCYRPGDLVMANSGTASSDGSEFFFIVTGGQGALSPAYTLVGRVVSGMNIIDKIGSYGASPSLPIAEQVPSIPLYLLKVTVKEISA